MEKKHLRFGVALARTRTKFQRRTVRKAYQFLKKARKTSHDYDYRPRTNRAWIQSAGLQEVLDFLSKRLNGSRLLKRALACRSVRDTSV